MQDRFIIKKLYDFSLKEYREKRPTEIIGYRVKKSVLLHRGYGPSIIVSGLQGQIVPFLILANYKEYVRLYYIIENGAIINAINIDMRDFQQEQLKFEKATKKLFQIPKSTVPEKKIEKIKQQLNEKFHNFISQIEKLTAIKFKQVPLITIYQEPIESKIIIKREKDVIKLPLELINHALLEGFLAREALRLIIASFVQNTEHAKKLELMGSYHLINKSLQQDWRQFWSKKSHIEKQMISLKQQLFFNYLNFLNFIGKYEMKRINDSKLQLILTTFSEFSPETERFPELAAKAYLDIANGEEYFLLRTALFYLLAHNPKNALKCLKEIPKSSKSENYSELFNYCEGIASYRFINILSSESNFKSIPLEFQDHFRDAFTEIQKQLLEIQRTHPQKSALNKSITIKFKIKNPTDLTFKNLRLSDPLPKRTVYEIIGNDSFYFPELTPNQTLSCEYELICTSPQKNFLFKNGNITFEDTFNNNYVQIIEITSIQIHA